MRQPRTGKVQQAARQRFWAWQIGFPASVDRLASPVAIHVPRCVPKINPNLANGLTGARRAMPDRSCRKTLHSPEPPDRLFRRKPEGRHPAGQGGARIVAEKQLVRPVMLMVLDGWGWREDAADNAVRQASTPNFDRLWNSGPHAFLRTSGLDVGLPPGQMGNSEVGHLNIGAGRVVMQDLPRIGHAIEDGSIGRAPALTGLIDALKQSGGTCHLLGLVSPGGVHSHQDHAVALARLVAD